MSKDNAAFFTATRRRAKTITLPGTRIKLTLRELTAAQGTQYLKLTQEKKSEDELFAQLLIMSAVDESGAPRFTEADIPDLVQCRDSVKHHLSTEILKLSQQDKSEKN